MSCENKYCKADRDSASAFDLSDDTITIYLDEMKKHPSHVVTFLFEDKVMVMGIKDNILQLWRDTDNSKRSST